MLPGRYRLGALLGVILVSLACGGGDGDGGNGPSGLTFPPLDDAVKTQYCVRGNTTVGRNESGSVTAQDCDYADILSGPGYYEVWRVRVAQPATVRFKVDAPNFNSYVDLIELTVSGGDVTNLVALSSDDNTNADDAELAFDLVPGTDYAVVVSGFDYPETGAYTLNISSTPPASPPGLTFPPLNASVNTQYCVKGNTTVGGNRTGFLSATDCDYADLDPAAGGYYEVWRVRVAQAATVTFTVSAPTFDSYIDVFQVSIASGDVGTLTPLGSDDDTIGDDPVLALDLVPSTDYLIVVSGFDYPEVGSYSLLVQ